MTPPTPDAIYLGPRPPRAVLRAHGSPYEAPKGYEVLESDKHVWAIPEGYWHEFCGGDGCRYCGWTGEAAKVKKPCKRCISYGHATHTCWRSARRADPRSPSDTCKYWVEDPTPREDT
jgi:hypothetical protein